MAEKFEQYAAKKFKTAANIYPPGVETLLDRGEELKLAKLRLRPFVERTWGGPFYYTPHTSGDPTLPSVNLIFVEDKNGDTGTDKPWELGGGDTDFMIYEGLSRVHADAVLAGAETIKGIALSVWQPDLVEYRTEVLGKGRHPINVITTRRGSLDIGSELVFNHPEVEVVVLTTNEGKKVLDPQVGERSWIHIESTGTESDLREGLRILKDRYGVEVVSAIGGRHVATDLINNDLVDDLYLTRTPIKGPDVKPLSPFYLGDVEKARELQDKPEELAEHFRKAREALEKSLELVARKKWRGPHGDVFYEHYIFKSPAEEVQN